MANKSYPVQWRLDHDGKTHQPPATVSLSKADAEPLLASGVIVEPPRKAATSKPAETPHNSEPAE